MGDRFQKVLIANRGEIACRVIRSARALGYQTVAVASDADDDALHAQLADEVVAIGPAPAGQSYLDAARLIAAARQSDVQAVHPGYGFLSENADFAETCAAAGIVFIGPSPAAIRAMGDKAESKRRMIAAGVPCVPGYEGQDQSDETLLREGRKLGLPLMVKASAGGGGRGMRLVEALDQLPAALASARSEAKASFGDARLLLERAIVDARHVEIQVFGDTQGHVVHLGERDCSVQRRHQKVVEEAPCPVMTPELRTRMGEAAVQAAKAIAYAGAGTVEFLLDSAGQFYFLEMNTRLQVEHPVTECVTGLDLVALQFAVAQGAPLPFEQADVRLTGHAIEVRLYAEDPANNFLPQTGRAEVWIPPAGEGVRVDHGLCAGASITSHYDPMIAKVIAFGDDREMARRRLVRALGDMAVLGVVTNKAFLIGILQEPDFVEGQATTAFIDRHFSAERLAPQPAPVEAMALAAALLAQGAGKAWRSNDWSGHAIRLGHLDAETLLQVHGENGDWTIGGLAKPVRLTLKLPGLHEVRWSLDGRSRRARYLRNDPVIEVDLGDTVHRFEDLTYAPPRIAAPAGQMRAPMSGTVVAVYVKPGDVVARGQVLMVLEAMKMEHQIIANADGVVASVAATQGAQVAGRTILVTLRDAGEPAP